MQSIPGKAIYTDQRRNFTCMGIQLVGLYIQAP